LTQKRSGKYTQIELQNNYLSNMPFGDDIHDDSPGEKIIFHNINGIKDEDNWHQIMATMSELNVDIFGFAEMNRTLNGCEKQKWNNIRKFFYYSRLTHSESNITMENYKPGGTITMIIGKWQSRITAQGQDERGLGRWSFAQINSKRKSLVIIMAYRPCASRGPTTAWMQQWTLLREKGDPNPDPIKQFYKDLEEFLQGWINKKCEILLMLDANETLGEKPGGISLVFGKTGLVDLLQHCHPHEVSQNTYARGTKQIDYIMGTAGVRDHCKQAGILPFGTGYNSDHRALFIVLDIESILSTSI
jgi:exonuclease III